MLGTAALGSVFDEYTALRVPLYCSKSEPRAGVSLCARHKQKEFEFEEKYCYGTIYCWAGSIFSS